MGPEDTKREDQGPRQRALCFWLVQITQKKKKTAWGLLANFSIESWLSTLNLYITDYVLRYKVYIKGGRAAAYHFVNYSQKFQ